MTVTQSAKSATIGISVSDSPDLLALGLSDGHLRDAAARIALGVLALGKSLAYGGDLRQHGFTRLTGGTVGPLPKPPSSQRAHRCHQLPCMAGSYSNDD